MTEETKQQEQQEQQEQDSKQQQDTNNTVNIRNHKAFLGLQEQNKKLIAKIESMELERENSNKAEETKKLEEREEYDRIVDKLRAEQEALVEKYEKQKIETEIRTALLKLEVTNDVFINGAIATFSTYEGDNIAEYIDSLASDDNNAVFFNKRAQPMPMGVVPSAHGSNKHAQLYADLNDPKKAAQASAELQRIYLETGQMPPRE